MVVAPIREQRTEDLRTVLAKMNRERGVVDPSNALVPFAQFDRLHFARFVVLEDRTSGDLAQQGKEPPVYPDVLAFLGDCDGPGDEFIASLVAQAEPGLREVFAHCEGYCANADLLAWMRARESKPAAVYVNWIGRTTRQIREEARLREFLERCLRDGSRWWDRPPREVHAGLRAEVCKARLLPGPPEPTPLGWQIRNLLHLIGVPLVLLLILPPLLLAAPLLVILLRRQERRDPEVDLSAPLGHVRALADMEDHDAANQFTAFGSIKPSPFRRSVLSFALWLVNYATHHIFNRGRLTRVSTIHFARWILLDNKRRLFFASNYDGSLESYMDDFINKVGWGLNLVFSNCVGYPKTRWLVHGGAKREQQFKRYIRRHELATEVWFNAHPGLTAVNLETNARIRGGIEKPELSDDEAAEWLRLFY